MTIGRRGLLLLCAALGCGPGAATSSDRMVFRTAEPAVEVAAPPEAPEVRAPPEAEQRLARVRGEVVLIPLGGFPDELLAAVEEGLRAEYDVRVTRAESRPLPKDAYYAPRRRYRADTLLEYLLTQIEGTPRTTRALGLTTRDISVTNGPHKDWGVFGYGFVPGKAAVISSFRLRRRTRDKALVERRVVTTAIHEIGHTFGLDHCNEHGERCPMLDAEGSIVNTDSSTGHLGPGCRASLERAYPRTLPP
ncbi:MAG: hypothetical protein R3A51_02105 [Nannocystaceae bacterium]